MSRSNTERTRATRQALIEAARRLFVEKGYAETATPDIVAAAGVTRGALYHHFEDKRALFRAVVEQEAAAVSADIEARAMTAQTPRDALISGARAYFDAMQVEGRTRLLLLDAPAVLGAAEAAAVDVREAESTLRAGLGEYLAGTAAQALLAPLTGMLSAAFDRAALAIEAGEDRGAQEAAIALVIDGLGGERRR